MGEQLNDLHNKKHVLHSASYWTEQWEELTGIPFDLTSIDINKQYKQLTGEIKQLKNLRSASKGVTFGLNIHGALAA